MSPPASGLAGPPPRNQDGVRRTEVLAALSLAIDLGLGQSMEHMLRSTLLGLRLAELLGVDQGSRGRLSYTSLLAWIACHADSFELAALFGDDIAFRRDYYLIDAHGLPMLSLMLQHTGSELPYWQRTARRSEFAATAMIAVRALIRSHCASAGALAGRVGLDADVAGILRHTFERWDGRGLPAGTSGVAIPLEMRIAHIADAAEVFLRAGGIDAARSMVRERSGTQFDPELAGLFYERAQELTQGLLELDPWPAVFAAAPKDAALTGVELDATLSAMGDFADLKSPWTAGHSRQVATLAAAAGEACGLQDAEVEALRRAGWTHDLGRLGVSNKIWDK